MQRFMVMIVIVLMVGCTQPSDTSRIEPATPEPPTATRDTEQVTPNPRSEESTTMSEETLSTELQQAVLEAVSAEQKVPVSQLEIVTTTAVDWPDSCLGLAGPDDMCAQMITPGWALTITDGQQTWEYRTDLDILQVKLEAS